MNERSPVDAALSAARPEALAALTRWFRDLDTAEEAFQEACVRALKAWPRTGVPRDPAAWLAFVGRNAGVDATRKVSKLVALDEPDTVSDPRDAEDELHTTLEHGDVRDDVLRLLFVCAHPELPPAHQVALALRVVSGIGVPQLARAFLVGEAAMEQRITRAKRRIAQAEVAFGTPDAGERSRRLGAVATMLYLLFNEGYSAGVDAEDTRGTLCGEAIRLTRLLLRLYPAEPELMGLLALMLLQDARATARFDATGRVVLLEDQDRTRWHAGHIGEGLALLDKALRHQQPGALQIQAAIAALHARAATAADTDWVQIAALYGALERLDPSPVVTLNRAVAVSKAQSPDAALTLIAPLAERLDGYFYFHGVRGALLKRTGRHADARAAFTRAITLARTPAEAAHIRDELDKLETP